MDGTVQRMGLEKDGEVLVSQPAKVELQQRVDETEREHKPLPDIVHLLFL